MYVWLACSVETNMKEGTILRKNNCYFHSPIYNISVDT